MLTPRPIPYITAIQAVYHATCLYRKASRFSLLQIIVLEDRPEYMNKVEKTELKEMEGSLST
jgi:hypothetical protein